VGTTVSGQLVEVAAALSLGAAVGLLYDFLRVVRRRVPARFTTLLCDFIFCTAAGLGLFVLGLTLGGGKTRAMLGVVAALGAALYFLTLTRLTMYLLEGFADIIGLFLRLCAFPAAFFLKNLKKYAIFLKKLFNYWRKWYIFKEIRLLRK
jgi:hypothetical protein